MFKRIVAVFLSVMLFAAGAGVLTSHNVSAAGSLRIIVNGQELQLGGASAYTDGPDIMLPLRETAQALKYKVSFNGATGTFLLERFQESVQFRLSGKELMLDGKNKVPFTGGFELKQKKAYAPLSFFAAIGLVTSYNPETGQVDVYTPEVMAGAVAGLLVTGNYPALKERYYAKDAEPAALPVLQQSLEGINTLAGSYFGVKTTTSTQQDGVMTIVSVLSFTKAEAVLTLELGASGKLTKLTLTPVQAASEVWASPAQP
ncbi:stalk domain-containing protein [Paenibacillus sp. FSL H8-0332]|uniref:stalk domain-containing protein n=1 Tax=Paenibacillus sp. FSL H8-0332 TaxID=2954742 RepID=UPI0030D4B996